MSSYIDRNRAILDRFSEGLPKIIPSNVNLSEKCKMGVLGVVGVVDILQVQDAALLNHIIDRGVCFVYHRQQFMNFLEPGGGGMSSFDALVMLLYFLGVTNEFIVSQ